MTPQEAGNIVTDFTAKAVLAGLREGLDEGSVEYLVHHAARSAIMQWRAEKEKADAGH